jgi:predicted RNase H-like nuclease (RuvC/YqgF family)
MKPRKEIPLAAQVENLELANRTLKNYIQRLEEKLAKYEKMLQHCPRFRAEQQLEVARFHRTRGNGRRNTDRHAPLPQDSGVLET